MPKKSTPVRSGAQRSKPKASKGFELVRPATQEPELVEVESPIEDEPTTSTERPARVVSELKATATVTKERFEDMADVPAVPQRRSRGRAAQNVSALSTLPAVPEKKNSEVTEMTEAVASTPPPSIPKTSATTTPSSKGNASERLAARRQGSQKAQQRNAATLITAEHYSYVRRDLMFIAVLALIMFIIIIVLYFVPGI